MNKAALTLSDLSTGYATKGNRATISVGINATLHAGELTCLLGPNGAGKSTLLRTLCGFQPQLDGRIEMDGRDLSDYTPRELSTRIGVVLTDRVDVRGMRVDELVAMGRSPYTGFWGGLQKQDHEAVADAIKKVGIQALATREVNTLSDGERQKAMIAKALAQQTPIILLDEPTAFLDFPSKVEMMLLLRRLAHETGKAIFLSTHDLDMALQTADRLWLLSKEEGLRIGTPRELATSDEINRFFPSTNMTFDAETMHFIITKDA